MAARCAARLARLMALTPIDEVWGIGRQLTAKLMAQGINTVADLVAADPKSLRRHYGVVVERTALELRGIPCADLEQLAKAKQQIICSRSFGARITEYLPELLSNLVYGVRRHSCLTPPVPVIHP